MLRVEVGSSTYEQGSFFIFGRGVPNRIEKVSFFENKQIKHVALVDQTAAVLTSMTFVRN
jgi:hypothetical protein